jgi:predicted phage terminase large subunit-like protein
MLTTPTRERPRYTIRHAATQPQREFIRSDSRTCAFIGGIGSGKTRASVLKALAQPAGSVGMLVAPTYPMLKDALLTTFLEIARPLMREFNKSDLDVVLADGKRIAFRSADNPDRLRGPNLGWAGLDEAALMDKTALDIMLGRLRLQPGRMWFTTTPKGRNHWLHEYANRDAVHTVRARSMDNPYLPPEFLDDLKRAYASDFYRQEVLGEFIEAGGLVFRDAFYYDALPDTPYREGVGVDFAYTAKSHADYSVAIRGRAYGETLYITDVVRGQMEMPAFAARLRGWSGARMLARIGGTEKGIVDFLTRDHALRIDTIPATTDKHAFAQPVAAAWNAGRVLLPRAAAWVPALLDEVLSFTGVNDTHDDIVDALGALHHALYATPTYHFAV